MICNPEVLQQSFDDGLQINEGIQCTLEEEFQPSHSSTMNKHKDEEVDNSDGIEISKSRGNQTLSLSEVGTQTTTDETIEGSMKSSAVFANRLLHAVYWCLVLSTFVGSKGFPHMKKTIESRHSIYEASAKRILNHLTKMGSCVIAGIAKPDFDFQKGTVDDVVNILQKLDHWILSSVNVLLDNLRDFKNPRNEELIRILNDVFYEQSVLAEDSKLMAEKNFLHVQ